MASRSALVFCLGFSLLRAACEQNVSECSVGEVCRADELEVARQELAAEYRADELEAAQRELAAGYRLLELYGHGDLAAGFFTCRSPTNASVALVAEQGLHFGEVRASDLVAFDIHTEAVLPRPDGRVPAVSRAARKVASAVYRKHADVGAFLHSHPKNAMALAASSKSRLLMATEPAFMFYERVAYESADFFFEDAYVSLLPPHFDDDRFVLHILNHAIMVAGKDVPQAFYRAYMFEQAAELQLMAFAAGGEVRETSHEESMNHRRSCEEWVGGFDGSLEWPGLLRKLDRMGSDYKL